MKARVEFAVDVEDWQRRAIYAHYSGDTYRPGLATRAQVSDWYRTFGLASEDRLKELAAKVDRDSAQCYRLRRNTLLIPHRSVLKVRGERAAEFVYLRWEQGRGGDHLTVVGGKPGHQLTRTFRPERVTKVRQQDR